MTPADPESQPSSSDVIEPAAPAAPAGPEPDPAAPEPDPAAPEPAPPPSPFAALPTGAGSVVRLAFDLLTRSSGDLRRSSFYIGLIVIGTIGPVVLLLWGAVALGGQLPDFRQPPAGLDQLTGWLSLGSVVAFIGFYVALIESYGLAIAVLGTGLAGRRVELVDAVERSRRVFWRVVGATLLVNVPMSVVQFLVGSLLAAVFHGESEITVVAASIVAAILATPFAYVLTGIVLGDVGVMESARRSTRLFSVRRRAALVVALFALAAQLLTGVGLVAGIDIVVRIGGAVGLGPSSGNLGIVVTTVVVIAVVFAAGTLVFTVIALSVAPQVAMFLALTHATPGLDRTRSAAAFAVDLERGRQNRPYGFKWLTRPMIVAFVIAGMSLLGGLLAISR